MVNGRWVMRDGKILTVDELAIFARAKAHAADVLKRANVCLPHIFNWVSD